MEIQQINITEIKEYEKNAKKHDTRQINNVMESIKEFGMVQPIVIDDNNTIIIGHCRYKALKKLKWEKVPVIKLENLSDQEVNKLRLLDNKLNESDWDFDLLLKQIQELNWDDFDIDWDIPEFEENDQDIKEATYTESISVVIDCDNEFDAESIYNKLKEEGYECRISTL